ncbi:MAG TPA: aminotransferase class V-fold PLP-dependent enzyme [Longimicrobium sp.]|jgi:aspartate aminotransferase-like enzyme|uniref:pyridoxal-phosphate-dependent aminotransferase family protein n=1 Tax=Longimicrobium sp. TaxID=2029185 RepID=UPI002EDAF342
MHVHLPAPAEFGRFFLPGPTEVHPDVLAAMTRPVIGHRGSEMSALLAACDPVLRDVFRTSRPVYVASSSATGLMEGAVRNAVRTRALSLVNGAFSARFRDLVDDCGREVEMYDVELGRAHDPEEVYTRLRDGKCDAVTVVHSETSTGVLNPLPAIAEAVRRAEAESGQEILLLVDGVTSVAGMLVETEAWGLDFLLTGSQKAFALPPGLAFGTASERTIARAMTLRGRGQYFDLMEYEAYAAKNQTPTTPAVSLIYALAEQCARIGAEGVEARAERHWRMAGRAWEWVMDRGPRWGLSLFAPEGARSPTVTTIAVNGAMAATSICAEMTARGWTLGTGYGSLKDTTFRIGHMGDHTVDELDLLLAALEEVLG